jgi:hypothetical protein
MRESVGDRLGWCGLLGDADVLGDTDEVPLFSRRVRVVVGMVTDGFVVGLLVLSVV